MFSVGKFLENLWRKLVLNFLLSRYDAALEPKPPLSQVLQAFYTAFIFSSQTALVTQRTPCTKLYICTYTSTHFSIIIIIIIIIWYTPTAGHIIDFSHSKIIYTYGYGYSQYLHLWWKIWAMLSYDSKYLLNMNWWKKVLQVHFLYGTAYVSWLQATQSAM